MWQRCHRTSPKLCALCLEALTCGWRWGLEEDTGSSVPPPNFPLEVSPASGLLQLFVQQLLNSCTLQFSAKVNLAPIWDSNPNHSCGIPPWVLTPSNHYYLWSPSRTHCSETPVLYVYLAAFWKLKRDFKALFYDCTSCQSQGSLTNFYLLWGQMVFLKQSEMSVMQNQYLKHPHKLKNNRTIHGRKIHWKLLIKRKYLWLRKSPSCQLWEARKVLLSQLSLIL